MVEKAATKDRVEFSKRRQVGFFQIRLHKIHVADSQKFLDEARLAQIHLAALHREDAFDTRMFRQDKTVGALERSQFQNRSDPRREAKKLLDPVVADRADRATVVRAIDPKLEDPRRQLRELRC